MTVYFRITLVLLGLILGSIIPAQVLALGISPQDINLQLEQGQQYQGEIFLDGSEIENVAVSVSVMDWLLTDKGEYLFLPAKVLKRSVAPWLAIDTVNFSLSSKMGQKIRYTINVPHGVNGSYWGAVIFRTNSILQKGNNPHSAISNRLAYIIRINIIDSPEGSCANKKYR